MQHIEKYMKTQSERKKGEKERDRRRRPNQ